MADDDETTDLDLGQDQFTTLRPLAHRTEDLAARTVTDPAAPGVTDVVPPQPRRRRVSPYPHPEDVTGDDA